MYFNSGGKILIEYFSQNGVSDSKTLFQHFLAKDKRRITKSKRKLTNNDKIEFNEKLQTEQMQLELQLI